MSTPLNRVSSMIGIVVAVCALAAVATAQQPKLEHRAKQAVERQERNFAEMKKLSEPFLNAEGTGPEGNAALLVARVEEYQKKCDAYLVDLEKNQCPADHPRVKAIVDGVAAIKKGLDAAKPALAGRAETAKKAADVSSYPEFAKDLERLEAIEQSYKLRLSREMAEAIAETMKSDAAVRAWVNEKAKAYKPLTDGASKQGSFMKNRIESTCRGIKNFTGQAQSYVDGTGKAVEGQLERAEKLLVEAIEKKNAAYFDGGIRQCMEEATARTQVFGALTGADNAKVKEYEAAIAALRAKVDKEGASMKTEILAAARAPEEEYTGADKAELAKSIEAAWKKKHPDDKIVKLVFHMKDWERTVKARLTDNDRAVEKIDMSVLCVTVIVRTSDQIATTYPAYVNRDNISESTKLGVDTKGNGYVHREILLKNL